MLERIGRQSLAAVVVIAAAMAAGASATPAAASTLPQDGKATVKSVDGPALLTITVGRRTLPVHLVGIDTPNAGECGAAETQQALEGFVRRASRSLQYSLLKTDGGPLTRDAAGRLWANLGYRVRSRSRDLSNDLVRAGWARSGVPMTLDAPVPELGSLSGSAVRATDAGREGEERPIAKGVAAKCGDRFHLPLGEPVVAPQPATWAITERGVTTAIGPITLSPVLTPSTTLTLGKLAELVPVELMLWFTPCMAYLPTLQLTAFSAAQAGPCRTAEVAGFFSEGRAQTDQGLKVGDSASAVVKAFPLVDLDAEPFGAFLSGPATRQWAWQAGVDIGDDDTVEGLFTYALPIRPES